MKIGVLSDTHLHDIGAAAELAEQLLAGPFRDVAAILHAGDAVIEELPSCFYPIPWYAVKGNMDFASHGLPEKRVLELNGRRIGMIHGSGAPAGLEQRVLREFTDQSLDVLVFGHSHQPLCRRAGDLLLFNPGSATDRRQAARHTVGVLSLADRVEGEILAID